MTASPRASSSPASGFAGRVLAIDYGRRRIGLALSDPLGLTAQPLETLARTNRRGDLRRLREIVRQHGVRRIVVGHPLNLDGTSGEMAAEAAQFAVRVAKQLRLPVELVDERLSSWEAEQILTAESALSGKRFGGDVDHLAAAVILRDYLERRHARTGAASSGILGAANTPARRKRKRGKS
jgi:putative Holliday junction resolvase